MKKIVIALFLVLISTSILIFYHYGRTIWYPVAVNIKGKRTVAEVIDIYGEKTKNQLSPLFKKAGLKYPPEKLALVAFKDTQILEIWASDNQPSFTLIKSYPIKAASGVLGPKLTEGDRQVPEGIYHIDSFNPNSSFHLSMKLNYPNAFDLKYAKLEARNEPGSNIFIHGKAVSIGCLAMGDEGIEELFSLVNATKREHTTVLISPIDPSKNKLIVPPKAPSWTGKLYGEIMSKYRTINSAYYVSN